MASEKRIPVVGAEGLIGYLAQRPKRAGSVGLQLTDGSELTVPASELRERNDGTYYLPHGRPGDPRRSPTDVDPGQPTIVPVVEEQLVIDKRPVATGRVRVHKKIDKRSETVDLPLIKERVDIRRVVIDREVNDFLPIRREGDTTIVPVVEEQLVVEKKLRLKEEIHISRRREEERHVEQVTLEAERAEIEQIDREGHSSDPEPEPEGEIFLGRRSGRRGFVRKNKVVT